MNDEGSIDESGGKGAEIYAEWKSQFLGGALSDEEARHCFNVGRVALEFARLEEEIGHLLFELDESRRDTGTEYMRYVKESAKIGACLTDAARRHPGVDVGWSDVADRYKKFAALRNRYAHASVGATAVVNPETGILEVKSLQEKHAKGESLRNLPTDKEIEDLCLAMRQLSFQLWKVRNERSIDRWAKLLAAKNAHTRGRRPPANVGDSDVSLRGDH